MQKTILVIFGGRSNENEISVITGTMVINVLKSGGYGVIPYYISQSGEGYSGEELADITAFKGEGYKKSPRAIIADGGVFTLKRGKTRKYFKVDAALNCCHGGNGENGGVSGLCAVYGIPFASAGIFESSAFMDKYLTKLVLSALNVKTAEYAYIKSAEKDGWSGDMPDFPVIVKPVNLGSSIGVEKAENERELESALECAFVYDSAVIVEKYLENRREINCAAYYYGGEVITSECEEAVTDNEILSFEDKYKGGGKSVLPADIPRNISELIKNTVKKVYGTLNMRGIVRFDFILCGNEAYLSEVNTVPGSLSYYLLSKGFKDFNRVLARVVEQSVEDFNSGESKKLLHTGILESVTPRNGKLGSK